MPAQRVKKQLLPRPLWLGREVWRLNAAMLGGGLLATIYELAFPDYGSEAIQITLTYIAWGIGAFTTYPLLTSWYFSTFNHRQLVDIVHQTRSRRRRLDYLLGGGNTGDWGSIIMVLSLGAVVAVLMAPTLKSNRIVLVMCALLVMSGWKMMVHLYAAYYLRTDTTSGGLDFPREQSPVYSDYVYFSQQIQTTFAGSDVDITSKTLRRAVNMHTLFAYVFSTVVVALLVSAILGLGG